MAIRLRKSRILEMLSLMIPALSLMFSMDRLFGFYITVYYDLYNVYIGIGLALIAAASLAGCLFVFKENRVHMAVEPSMAGIVIFFYVVNFWLYLYEREYFANYNSFAFYIFHRRYVADAGFRNIYMNTVCAVSCYAAVLSLYSLIKIIINKSFLQSSLLFRAVTFLTKGKSVRKAMSLYIIASGLLTVPVLFVMWEMINGILSDMGGNSGLQVVIWTALIMLAYNIILLVFVNFKGSVVRDMDTICGEINSLSESELPDRTKIPEKSILSDTAAKLVNVGSSMQQAIDKGIAGERLKVELITNVSHDLKTPLTSIVGYGELLEKMDMPAEAKEYVIKLNHKSKYLLAMLEDVFDLSKASTGNAVMNRIELDIVRLVRQTLGELADSLDKTGAKLCTCIPDESIIVNTDGSRMHRVFQNLLDNAVKYSLAGSRIFVTITRDAKTVSVEIMNTSSYEMNFTPERISERFVRGDEARTGEGSGIGLAIAKTYTEACGGSFDIGIKGDQFTVTVKLEICEDEPQ